MKYLKIILGISILVSVGLFLKATDFSEVWTTLQQIGLKAFYILISTFFAYIIGSLGWKFCLGKDFSKVSLFQLFVFRHIGETLALFNPTSIIAGDWLKAEALKKHGIESDTAVNSVLLSRILMVVSQMFLLIITLIWLVFFTSINLFPHFKLWMGGLLTLLVIALCGISLFFLREKAATSPSSKIWVKQLKEYKQFLSQYLKVYPKYTFWAFVFFALHWLVGSLEMYFILKILDYDVKVIHGLLMDMGVILVKSVGAFIPGQVGIEELGNKLVIMMVGISSTSLWITVSILRRSRQMFWSAIGGLLYLIYRKRIL